MNKSKFLTSIATAVYVVAIFLPWLQERYHYSIVWPPIYPPPSWRLPIQGRFWSFQAVIDTFRGGTRYILWNHWFRHNGLYLGWLGVFLFQIVTVVLALMNIFKKKIKAGRSYLIITVVMSAVAPALCVYQRFKQIEGTIGAIVTNEFSYGFWLAIASVTLFSASCWLACRSSKSS